MANQMYQAYMYTILGDGSSTSISFDMSAIPLANSGAYVPSPPDDVYLQQGAFNGAPSPLPNVTSITVSGYIVTVNFDAALTAFNVNTSDGFYTIAFFLVWNA